MHWLSNLFVIPMFAKAMLSSQSINILDALVPYSVHHCYDCQREAIHWEHVALFVGEHAANYNRGLVGACASIGSVGHSVAMPVCCITIGGWQTRKLSVVDGLMFL